MLKITLEGPAGSGKTFFAHEISRICKETGYTAVIVDDDSGKATVVVKKEITHAR